MHWSFEITMLELFLQNKRKILDLIYVSHSCSHFSGFWWHYESIPSYATRYSILSCTSYATLQHLYSWSATSVMKILADMNALVQVELEKLRLICERIIRREKKKVSNFRLNNVVSE